MFVLLQLPPIPGGISNEGLLAVLFMVLLGAAGVLYALAKGWLRIGGDERALVAALNELAGEVRALKEAIKKNTGGEE